MERRHTTKMGAAGPDVFPIALGCMGMTAAYGDTERSQGIATIREAVERGVNVLDTGDFYGMGANELLVREAIAGCRDQVLISVKFGALRGPDHRWGGVDTRPAAVKNFAAYSLQRLGVDVIDIYRPARLDPQVPIEDTVGAISELVEKGYVRYIGLSEVGADTIRRANATHPIVDLQIEYSLASRKPEASIFPTLAELGISATLYGVLSRGLLTGSSVSGPRDFRAYLPRFSGDAAARNAEVVRELRAFAESTGRTPAQLCVAWALTKHPSLVPLVGARKPHQLIDVLGALDKPLSAAESAAVEVICNPDTIEGTRYAEAQMAHLDSER